MIKKYYLKPKESFDEIKKKEGTFINNFSTIIDHDCNVYYQDDTNEWKVLLIFRKNIIPEKYNDIALNSFKEETIKANALRGKAGGIINKKLISPNIKKILNPKNFQSKIMYKNGKISKYYIANRIKSLIVGYFDKPKLSEKANLIKSSICRTTAFTEKYKNTKWKQSLPLFKLANKYYKKYLPKNYNEQLKLTKLCPKYKISGTAFSTVTINYNWQTAVHLDVGDYHNGYSVLMVAEEGNYTGGYLGYPEYDIAVDIRKGDFALMNPHKWHCNTKLIGESNFTRLSMVMYFRENILKCSSKGIKIIEDKIPNIKVPTVKLISVNDIKFYIRPNTTDIKVIEEVIKSHVYQKKKIGFIPEEGETWFDIGSNIGTFTLFALNLKCKKIYAYEPEPHNNKLFKLNIKANGYDSNHVQLNEAAVFTKEGKMDLFICKGDYNKYRHTLYKIRGRESISVPVLDIKDEIEKYKPDCIKMDIEGAEIDILEYITLSDLRKWKLKKLVFEYSFDIDPSVERFFKIINKLKKYFTTVYFTKVKETDIEYKFYPAMTIVYCLI